MTAAKGALAITLLRAGDQSASAFTTLKHEYSFIVPFHADEVLADMDAALAFHVDPWESARNFPGVAPAPMFSFALYSQLWFVGDCRRSGLRGLHFRQGQPGPLFRLLRALSVILLSSLVRIAGSSAGPVFYDRRIMGGDRFADLIGSLERRFPAGPKTLGLTDYLYSAYTSQHTVLGTGISAMPSLHVALAFLNALFLASRHRIAGRIAWAYARHVILFGSVYFGWHYAWMATSPILSVLIDLDLARER